MKYLKLILFTLILFNQNLYAQKPIKKNVQPKESNRIYKIRNAEIGDQICYSQNWTHTESHSGFFDFQSYKKETNFKMIVDCYIEKKNGDKIQVRIAKIESDNNDLSLNPTYRGIKMYEGDVIWINPIKDEDWIICE